MLRRQSPGEGVQMTFAINHIHLKADDPQRSAAWWGQAFNFRIVNDELRAGGVRFVTCESENGIRVNISGVPTGETLARGDAGVHEGIEHFGFDSENLEADIARLEALGATCVVAPFQASTMRVAFVEVPDHVRIELMERPS